MAVKPDIKKTIETELKDMPDDFIVAVVSAPENYAAVNLALAGYLTKKRKMSGVYITMNKPYKNMVATLEKEGVDTKKIFFIDAISGIIGDKKSANGNCVMLPSPGSLTEMGIVISKVCDKKNPRFMIMDSLSTLLLYNNQRATLKFVHYVTTQLRKCAWPGIIFSLEKDIEEKILTSMTQFCDKVIKI